MTDVALKSGADPLAKAKLHTLLRFGVGVTGGFVLAEVMGWTPTFLAPMLTAVLLANLPVSPPLKVGILLAGVMTGVGRCSPSSLSSLLRRIAVHPLRRPRHHHLRGAVHDGQGQAALPMTLLLLCVATIPVVTIVVPAYADLLPTALARGMVVAVLIVWLVFAIWPEVTPPAAKPPAAEPRLAAARRAHRNGDRHAAAARLLRSD